MKRLGPLCLLLVTACAGARTTLRFEGLEHPVSMSPHLPAEPGAPEPTLIGSFRRELRAFAFVYGLVAVDEEVDPSPLIEEEIRRLGGAGVINLEIEVSHCVFNYVIPFSLLPFWPNCARIELRGEVVGPPPSAQAKLFDQVTPPSSRRPRRTGRSPRRDR